MRAVYLLGAVLVPIAFSGCVREPSPKPGTPAVEAPPQAAKPKGRVEDVKKLVLESRQAFERGETKKALAAIDLILEIEPGHEEATLNKARLHRRRGHPDEALAVLQKGLESQPQNGRFVYEKAFTQVQSNQPREALETIKALFALPNAPANGRYLKALALASLRDREGTLLALEDAVEHGYTDFGRMKAEERFELLAGDEKFQGLLTKLGNLPESKARTNLDPWDATEEPIPLPEAGRGYPLALLVRTIEASSTEDPGKVLDLEFKDLDGKPLRLRDYQGKPLVLHVWGTWTWSNKRQLPLLAKLRQTYAAKGLQVLGLCYELDTPRDAAEGAVRAYLKDSKVDLPCAVIDKDFATALEVTRVPTTIFIAPNGGVSVRAQGLIGYDGLEALANAFLERYSPHEAKAAAPSGSTAPGDK